MYDFTTKPVFITNSIYHIFCSLYSIVYMPLLLLDSLDSFLSLGIGSMAYPNHGWKDSRDYKCIYWDLHILNVMHVLPCLALLCLLALPCLALPCLALPCLALSRLALPYLALPCLALPCLALPCLALPCLALHLLALPCLALPCLALPCLVLSCLVLSVLSCFVLRSLTIHSLRLNRCFFLFRQLEKHQYTRYK